MTQPDPAHDAEPKSDEFPDGWGMKVPPRADLNPEQALEYAKQIEKSRQHPKGLTD